MGEKDVDRRTRYDYKRLYLLKTVKYSRNQFMKYFNKTRYFKGHYYKIYKSVN